MCNYLHDDSKPIQECGTGWKMFQIIDGEYYPICYTPEIDDETQCFHKKHRNVWFNDSLIKGFCFFLSRNEALRLYHDLLGGSYKNGQYVVLPIKYKQGMGQHNERYITGMRDYQIALCKEFKITSEEPVYENPF
jgi:hypothetical protein